MKASLRSMLTVTFVLILLVAGTIATARAQTEEKPDIAPPYERPKECALTDEQKSGITDAVFDINATLNDYAVKEVTYLNCYYDYTNNNDVYFYGGMKLADSQSELRFGTIYFGGTIINDEINVTYVSEPWMEYNFSGYFTGQEEQKLGYYVKQKLIDIEVYGEADQSVWFQVNVWPQYRCLVKEGVATENTDTAVSSIRAPCGPADTEMTSEEFKAKFDELVQAVAPEDSFYYENQWSHMGLVKLPYSKVRELIFNDWATSIDFFGESLRFTFSGNVTISANLDDVLAKLKEQGFTVCSPEDSRCSWDSEKMAWYNPATFGLYMYRQYGDNVWFSASAYGTAGGDSVFYASLGGQNVDQYIEPAKAEIKGFASMFGIDLGEVEFRDNAREPVLYEEGGEVTATTTPAKGVSGSGSSDSDPGAKPEMVEYKYLSFEAKISIPRVDESFFDGWEKQEGMFYTQYTKDNMGVTIGEPYVSYWQKSGEYDYDSVQIGENEAYSSVTIDVQDYALAASRLTDKVGQLASVTGEWNLEYYPIGQGGWGPLYRYGILKTDAEASGVQTLGVGESTRDSAIPPEAPMPPSFNDGAGAAFEAMKSQVNTQAQVPVPIIQIGPAVAIISLVGIIAVSSLIFFLFK